jgi:serine/threonine-protein kinase
VVRQDPDLARVPAKVRPLLERCLAKDPKRRLRDVGDAMLLLEGGTPAPAAATSSRTLVWVLAAPLRCSRIGLAAVSYFHFRETPAVAEVVDFRSRCPKTSTSRSGAPRRYRRRTQDRLCGLRRRQHAAGVDPIARFADSGAVTEARINQQPVGFFWSPDSAFVAYGDSKTLKKISASGGPPETLAEIAPVLGGTWSQDGTILFGR